jgi:hypothetical protein
MRLVRACLVLFVALASLGVRQADALCVAPSPGGFSPRAGTPLPARAVVYLFVMKQDSEAPPSIDLDVAGAHFFAHHVATMPAYHAVRVVLAASAPEVTIEWKSGRGRPTVVRYPIGAPAPPDARVTGMTHRHHAWGCSHTNTIDVALISNAIAYRLVWSDGESVIMPATHGDLRRGDDLWRDASQGDASKHVVQIGHVDCLGYTVAPEALVVQRELRLEALFSDGSVRRFGPAHAQLGRSAVMLPRELQQTTAQRPARPRP